MLPSEVLLGPAPKLEGVGPPGLGRDTLSWDPAFETITPYASIGLGKADKLDLGLKSAKAGHAYSPGPKAAMGHAPTGRLAPKKGDAMTPAQMIGARSPGPVYNVSTVLDGPSTRFSRSAQRPPVQKQLSPGPVYNNNATIGAVIKHTYENIPKYSMQGRTEFGSAFASPRKPYEGPLGTLPKGHKASDGSSPRGATGKIDKGEIEGVCSALGKQVEGKMKSAPLYGFLKSEQRPDITKGPYLGKELEYTMKGRMAANVPNYVVHTPGLAQSPRLKSSPRMTFSHEPRF